MMKAAVFLSIYFCIGFVVGYIVASYLVNRKFERMIAYSNERREMCAYDYDMMLEEEQKRLLLLKAEGKK